MGEEFQEEISQKSVGKPTTSLITASTIKRGSHAPLTRRSRLKPNHNHFNLANFSNHQKEPRNPHKATHS